MQDFVYGEDFCPIYRGTHRVGNSAVPVSPRKFFSISCVAIAVENLTRHRRRKNCDASTYQSNNFGVSPKRFKSSTPGSSGSQTNKYDFNSFANMNDVRVSDGIMSVVPVPGAWTNDGERPVTK